MLQSKKGTPANLNITLRHFKNIKASQPAIFFYYCQWEKGSGVLDIHDLVNIANS